MCPVSLVLKGKVTQHRCFLFGVGVMVEDIVLGNSEAGPCKRADAFSGFSGRVHNISRLNKVNYQFTKAPLLQAFT